MIVKKVRCKTCHGSGKVMGGGMMLQDCEDCDGRGKIEYEDFYEDVKNSPEYNKAVDKIAQNENVSQDKAKEMFEDEFNKLEPKKRGRLRVR